MKKQSGFTLIELVIVIIILGILAATAVPKFVDLQGDARASAMAGVKGALEGAATLTYSRAAIDGHEALDDGTTEASDVVIAFGYPEATKAALQEIAGLSETDWKITDTTTDGAESVAITENGVEYAAATECYVTYAEAVDATHRPIITVSDDDC